MMLCGSYLLALDEPVPCLVLLLTEEAWLFMTVLTFEALSGDMGAAEEWALLVPLAL